MASSRLGNNPLLNTEPTFDVEAERQRLGVDAAKIGRKRNENIIRDKGTQQGLTEDWTRATFIIEVEKLELIKDYAYTERLKLKEVMQMAFDQFIEQNIKPMQENGTLLKHR